MKVIRSKVRSARRSSKKSQAECRHSLFKSSFYPINPTFPIYGNLRRPLRFFLYSSNYGKQIDGGLISGDNFVNNADINIGN